MFSFFEKKVYLADYLHGLVDIHNHILPGIDDGAKTVEQSIELLKGFGEFGVTNFICTPHIMHNYYDNTPKTIEQSYEKLKNKLVGENLLNVNIDCAAEHMIDDNFEDLLEKGEVMPLKKEYILIEMSYLQPSLNFEMAVGKIAKNQLFPILAHPERYMYLHPKYGKYEHMKSSGIQFQLNLLSLSPDSYGDATTKMAGKLIDDELINFVGTDIHNIRQLAVLKETRISKKLLKRLLPIIEHTIYTFY
ncbi:CpsB/CapC family capsule biosynthesis tyrosine phosphatase [Muricauda sp. ANG21]|uniref:tyrosine-protein phosphatase n=1 Tax=Allomuricauda sp. ANG21 TaxID=3042468 RepID=UPI003455AAED